MKNRKIKRKDNLKKEIQRKFPSKRSPKGKQISHGNKKNYTNKTQHGASVNKDKIYNSKG